MSLAIRMISSLGLSPLSLTYRPGLSVQLNLLSLYSATSRTSTPGVLSTVLVPN